MVRDGDAKHRPETAQKLRLLTMRNKRSATQNIQRALFAAALGMAAHHALAFANQTRNEPPKRRPRGVKNTTMKSPVCDMLGIEFPLFAFSHCRDVVAAVSRAGGFGVLGATTHSPESIEQELKWIDDHVDGKPYGLDVLIPENISTAGEKDVTWKSLEARVSPEHRAFTRDLSEAIRRRAARRREVADDQPQPFDPQIARWKCWKRRSAIRSG